MPDKQSKKKLDSRRRLLSTLTFTGGVAATLKSLPGDWKLPIVDSVVLPAHAQTSFPATCSIPFSLTFSGMPRGDPGLVNIYDGTQSAGGPFRGDCTTAGFAFNELPLVVTITDAGGGLYRINYNLDSGLYVFEFVGAPTEVMTLMMGLEEFDHTVNRDFTVSGFPAHETTHYSFTIDPGDGTLAGLIDGIVLVNEAAGP